MGRKSQLYKLLLQSSYTAFTLFKQYELQLFWNYFEMVEIVLLLDHNDVAARAVNSKKQQAIYCSGFRLKWPNK